MPFKELGTVKITVVLKKFWCFTALTMTRFHLNFPHVVGRLP